MRKTISSGQISCFLLRMRHAEVRVNIKNRTNAFFHLKTPELILVKKKQDLITFQAAVVLLLQKRERTLYCLFKEIYDLSKH